MTLGQGWGQFCVFATFWAVSVALSSFFLFGSNLCKNTLATVIFDGIFGFVAFLSLFWCNLTINNGEFRLFVLFAVALGTVTSWFTFKSMLDKFSTALYNLFTNEKVDDDGKAIL